ncbi:MAG: AAA family ATPase [Rhodospirillaceae bacterium]|nr:AAA family ATPase [Rhodospirillaceae bacterium]
MLISLSGLPGVGNSTIARRLAAALDAVWLRIDSIEQAIRDSALEPKEVADAGYRVGYAIAEDNLRVGRTVIADSVNPWGLTRNAWRDAGRRAGADVIEVEVICSDATEHRRRVETRASEIAGHQAPSWRSVRERDFQPWDRGRLIVDTASASVEACIGFIMTLVEDVRSRR